jgi:hypothetical protein
MQANERESLILHYAAIATQCLLENDPDILEQLHLERASIEAQLGMSLDDIILEAKRLIVR